MTPRKRATRRGAVGAGAFVFLALWICPLLALPGATQERLAVQTEPGTPVIATEVLIATGPADEEPGEAGLAHLAARAVTAPIQPVLDSLGVRLLVAAQKDALSFSLIAAPEVWEEATRALMIALFRDPADSVATVRERRSIEAELAGRQSNPADAAAREADAAFYGPDHPWGRAAVGSPRTVERLSVTAVEGFLRENFRPERMVVAVVGPLDAERARRHLLPFLGSVSEPFPLPAPAEPEDSPVERDYNTVTTWVTASYGFPANSDLEALRLLTYLATESLSFGPSRRSVYNFRGELLPRLGGGEIRFQLVVPPDEAERWAEQIVEAVEQAASRSIPDDVFEARLRRYRGERLLELAAPEERAHELARQLLLTGGGTALPDLDGLTLERLRVAARSLGPPTVVFLGPFFDDAN